MKIQRGIINKTIIAICSLALSFCTGIHAEELRLTNSNGIITINTNDGSVTIDTDDIEDNAQALDALEGQLNNIYFKYESGYYWAKSSADSEWEKIGAVGNTEPWMVLKNTGDKDITFSSQSGVDIAGAMENYAGNKELLVTSDAMLSNIGGTDCLSLEVPSTGYYTASDNALGADTTKLNYALSKLGDAGVANVLDGKYFTSSAGIRTEGSMANHSEDVTNKNSKTGYLPKNGANYLSVTVPYTGYYTDATKLITGVKYNPTGRVSQMPNKQTIDQNIGNANPNLASSVLKLGMNQSLTIPAGYYSNDIVIDNGVKDKGVLVNEVAHAFYCNNMFSQGGRSNININASKGNNEGIWARDEKNSSISDVIPLTLKDGNGVPYAILNNIIVTVGISSAAYYGGYNKPKSEASLNYSVTTNRGNTVISRSFSGSSTDTYNLFGITGLDGADSITFNSNAHVSVNMDGCSYGDRYVTATTTLSYVLQYINLKF